MTPGEQGRYCGQCQKTVIDFTTWTDAELFGFFAKASTGSVCGRFFGTQLQKELHLPPQPRSRLYRLAMACGLTLLFAQAPQAHAMVKPQVELLATACEDGDPEKTNSTSGSVRGRVTDKSRRPVAGAIVEVSLGGLIKAHTVTNKDGRYEIKGLSPGVYAVTALHPTGNREDKTLQVATGKEGVVNFAVDDIPRPIMGTVAYPPVMKGGVEIAPSEPGPSPERTEKGKVRVER